MPTELDPYSLFGMGDVNDPDLGLDWSWVEKEVTKWNNA